MTKRGQNTNEKNEQKKERDKGKEQKQKNKKPSAQKWENRMQAKIESKILAELALVTHYSNNTVAEG